jgi:hypothetical protein
MSRMKREGTPEERSTRLCAEGLVEFGARICHADRAYPSGLVIKVFEAGVPVGHLIPQAGEAGTRLVEELHKELRTEVPKSWYDLVEEKARNRHKQWDS